MLNKHQEVAIESVRRGHHSETSRFRYYASEMTAAERDMPWAGNGRSVNQCIEIAMAEDKMIEDTIEWIKNAKV